MEGIKDVSPRDEDMMSFTLNLVKEAKWSTNYTSDLTNFFFLNNGVLA